MSGKLPITVINGKQYYWDAKKEEFQSVEDKHNKITFQEIEQKPELYIFEEPVSKS